MNLPLRFRPVVEALETRRYPSATAVTATLVHQEGAHTDEDQVEVLRELDEHNEYRIEDASRSDEEQSVSKANRDDMSSLDEEEEHDEQERRDRAEQAESNVHEADEPDEVDEAVDEIDGYDNSGSGSSSSGSDSYEDEGERDDLPSYEDGHDEDGREDHGHEDDAPEDHDESRPATGDDDVPRSGDSSSESGDGSSHGSNEGPGNDSDSPGTTTNNDGESENDPNSSDPNDPPVDDGVPVDDVGFTVEAANNRFAAPLTPAAKNGDLRVEFRTPHGSDAGTTVAATVSAAPADGERIVQEVFAREASVREANCDATAAALELELAWAPVDAAALERGLQAFLAAVRSGGSSVEQLRAQHPWLWYTSISVGVSALCLAGYASLQAAPEQDGAAERRRRKWPLTPTRLA